MKALQRFKDDEKCFLFHVKSILSSYPHWASPSQANPSPGLVVCPNPPSGRTTSKTLSPTPPPPPSLLPPPLDTLTTALVCILSLILNHVARQIERISRQRMIAQVKRAFKSCSFLYYKNQIGSA